MKGQRFPFGLGKAHQAGFSKTMESAGLKVAAERKNGQLLTGLEERWILGGGGLAGRVLSCGIKAETSVISKYKAHLTLLHAKYAVP